MADDITPEILAEALNTAFTLLRRHDDWDLLRALAEATTTAQCKGIQGFTVYAALRTVIGEVLPGTACPYTKVAEFSAEATQTRALDVLKSAHLSVTTT